MPIKLGGTTPATPSPAKPDPTSRTTSGTPATGDKGAAVQGGQPSPVDGRLGQNTFTGAVKNVVDLAASKDLGGQVKSKLVQVAWSQLTADRSFSLGSVQLGPNATVGVKAMEQVLKPTDALVANDPQRGAYERANPAGHLWARTGGLVSGDFGLSTSIPVASGSASLGFSTGATLQYSVLAPYGLNAQGALDLAKENTVDLPLTSGNALKMAQGQEFSVTGTGRVGASASLSVLGGSVSAGPATVGASVGASGGVTAQGQLTLNVKRLDGSKVYVRIGKEATLSGSARVGLDAGTQVSASALKTDADQYVSLPDGAVGSWLEGKASGAVAGAIQSNLKLQASATASASADTQDVASFVLDLSRPGAQEAYAALLRLDTGPASRLAAQRDGAASAVSYAQDSTSKSTGLNLELGPAKLLLINSLKRSQGGTLTGADGSTLIRNDSLFQRSSSGFLNRADRQVTWEGVSVQAANQPAQTYFHLSYRSDDQDTTTGDMNEVTRFAQVMGAKYAAPPELNPGGSLIGKLFNGSFGKTKTNLDVYFTRDGLQRIAGATDAQVLAAFGQAAQAMEGTAQPPAWSRPEAAAAAQQALAAYADLLGADPDVNEQRRQLAVAYKGQFGRDIEADQRDLKAVKLLQQQVASMRGQPEATWIQAFSTLGAQAHFDFWAQLAALNTLADPENTLVHQLTVTGDRARLSAADEGLVADDSASAIGKALSPP